ncbi:serine hydrolase domain-containing protein [Luteipulveratus mongoliensis]|uniref:Beta-lactamase n=1 Tax=Luteipulveratus mongoliensis TaxID=571913 RepID=A0A0K1JN22_9MICO|nr:serine hydrolase domain-containing protein [Luteipulveratus mongoliensis]AKU18114.1 beta-lactamase [Luteipulveratus mongoliensis]
MSQDNPAISPEIDRELTRLATKRQVEGRVPGLLSAVARDGKLLWSKGIGAAELSQPDVAPGVDTHFQVASNTKTFTAVMVMQLRDEGRLTLDDTVDQHISETTHPQVTIRQLLAHTTGMQREPVGDVWDTLDFPDREGLVDGWNQAERIMRPHTHWHYSNLGYSILGEIIARLDGREWGDSLQARLLDPLGLARTGLKPTGQVSGTYFVPPFTDVPVEEPRLGKGATAPAGGIWSTASDMAAWHGFLAAPDSQVLSPDTIEEMCQPQIVADTTGWTLGWGLGLEIARVNGRTWVGHTGGLPGAITGMFTERASATTGLSFMNATNAPDPRAVAVDAADYVREHAPAPLTTWSPGTSQPAELVPLIGRWYSEGTGFTFVIKEGHLEARIDGLPAVRPSSVFERVADDVYRTVAGREKGELLQVRRHSDGSVRQLNWATYRFTREPLTFGDTVPQH